MASLSKKFHQKAKASWDIDVPDEMEEIQLLSEEIQYWCTYDCYYCDCGYPCPDDEPCKLNLLEMCKALDRLMKPIEQEAEEFYLKNSRSNV